MFSTFVNTPQSQAEGSKGSNLASPSFESPDPSSVPSRQKRIQVARACDWCRTHRIKCDNNVPCKNCHSRGRECSKDSNEARALAQAYSEIDRLKQEVGELKEQLKEGRNASESSRPNAEASSPMKALSTTPNSTKKYWDGVYASAALSSSKTLYGPSSLFYFISRMNTYLTTVFQQLHLDEQIQLNSVSKSYLTPNCDNSSDDQEESPSREPAKEFLTLTEEEYFLSLFWQSYHSSTPVLNELDFKNHYKSLWVTPGKPRRQSALVDIVIALSMQYGMSSIPRSSTRASADVDINDPTIAGRCYYRRCQSLLASELESPKTSTLQCQVLSAIYLCCASFQNMAHSTIAIAACTAQMLGLHHEPAESLPIADKEMRKRLYWSLYTLESKTCMKIGRLFSLNLSSTLCSLPGDDHAVAMASGSDFAPLGENVTWLSYNLHNTKLILAVRAVHMALYDNYSNVCSGDKDIYDDPEALERNAHFLSTITKALDTWAQAVPDALKTKREADGASLSTDRSRLTIERFAPLWLQRQRLLLELMYHNLTMNLHRPFITFPAASTPVTQSHASSAVNHSMALTHIMHQVLTETDILHGWHEAFQWQWNAAITLVGYLIAYPNSSSAGAVRQAVNYAVAVFEVFGRSFAAPNSAATVMRDLAAKADYLANDGQVDRGTGLVPMSEDDTALLSMFAIDSSSGLEMLWPGPGPGSEWGYDFGDN